MYVCMCVCICLTLRYLSIHLYVYYTLYYTINRCWTYETAVCLDTEINDIIPYNDYFEYFGPDYLLKIPVSNMENYNTTNYLDNMCNQVYISVCDIYI